MDPEGRRLEIGTCQGVGMVQPRLRMAKHKELSHAKVAACFGGSRGNSSR